MLVVLDPYKGFSFTSEKPFKLPKSRSNGFDVLNWEEFLPSPAEYDEINSKNEEFSGSESPLKSLKFTRLERKQIKKKAAALKRKLRLQPADDDNSIVDPDLNHYTLKQRLKKLHHTISGNGKDCKIFDIGLVSFYRLDVDYIVPGEWLNDNNISFVYEALLTYFIKPHRFGFQVYLLFPALVQLFVHYPVVDEIRAILPLKELSKLKFVFIPFNFIDESDLVDLEDANSGDHWALCVLSIPEKKLFVYDSMTFDDEEEDDTLLLQLATRLQSALFRKNEPIKIVKMKCCQQTNFDDCGVFLVMFSCYLVMLLMSEQATDLDIGSVAFDALAGRCSMMELVHKLALAEKGRTAA